MNNNNETDILEKRKSEHLKLALESQTKADNLDRRFYYEPLLSNNNLNYEFDELNWFGKKIKTPIWVSSMTGGTLPAKKINYNIAKACNEFGMGMGLGSCRILLENKKLLDHFMVRNIIGNKYPLFANLGIAQIEKMLYNDQIHLIHDLISDLDADGLIIHINLLQEFLQNEGDQINYPPIKTLKHFLKEVNYPIIIKEVGQGMGPKSIKAVLSLPIEAFEFAAFGGTNFSKLEINRNDKQKTYPKYNPLSLIGHDINDMIQYINAFDRDIKCNKFIISGGIQNFLDGYYAMEKLKFPSIYGQASKILKYAKKDYKTLYEYLTIQINGLKIASKILEIK
ncbi:MAG: type 2 isopentenyl-diphosphate Delta-isomerase [Bacteroidetes bacterium]|nr:type 2 isopentenyl-diphosphate Delta-isomerase [Bacteroidota bacterium]